MWMLFCESVAPRARVVVPVIVHDCSLRINIHTCILWNPRNLPYFICFLGIPLPAPSVNVICRCPPGQHCIGRRCVAERREGGGKYLVHAIRLFTREAHCTVTHFALYRCFGCQHFCAKCHGSDFITAGITSAKKAWFSLKNLCSQYTPRWSHSFQWQ